MKLYIKEISNYQSDTENIDIKKELKSRYKLDTRRQNQFIHLALIGAERLKEKVNISLDTELYITSNIGNIDVLQKAHSDVYLKGEFVKPYDFINMLGNTTNYYVSASFGIKDKNIFQISDSFSYIHSLISIYGSKYNKSKNVILGSVNLVSNPDIIIKRILGVLKDDILINSSSYQLLSFSNEDSIAELKFDTKIYSKQEIDIIIDNSDKQVVQLDFSTQMNFNSLIYKNITENISVLFIDSYNETYKILELNLLTK